MKRTKVNARTVPTCKFCAAPVNPNIRRSSLCLNAPLLDQEVSCKNMMKLLSDPKCKICKGEGVAFWWCDKDVIEGFKMASKKTCDCITGGKNT